MTDTDSELPELSTDLSSLHCHGLLLTVMSSLFIHFFFKKPSALVYAQVYLQQNRIVQIDFPFVLFCLFFVCLVGFVLIAVKLYTSSVFAGLTVLQGPLFNDLNLHSLSFSFLGSPWSTVDSLDCCIIFRSALLFA